jgi:hypothetical protein
MHDAHNSMAAHMWEAGDIVTSVAVQMLFDDPGISPT